MIINGNSGYFKGQQQGYIPIYLVSKMRELGIDPNLANDANQARELIAEAENSEKNNSNINIETSNSNKKVSQEPNKDDTYQRAIMLANKLGVSVPSNTPIEKLVNILENVIQNLMELAYKKNDLNLMEFLKGCKQELEQIKTIISNAPNENGDIKLNNYMDLLAEQNKAILTYKNRIA